ncbi:LysR family transcriptional regulator [Pseudoalteromonas sp. C2R02]|uniref:LysR family transcriptional regulator n=1 Tax=Pseudoalteromonas sp. C2R02 TaxID=2841565 RepID=UPI001C082A68|nr:LysR family transcriptional regulator [Pseudoalteromonas sp. C2R02]MBU2970884.1 LysR family transcriptional regulator [Pseudoalteromonas sp. C2R02]
MLDLIRIFIKTVDCGSFSKAGVILNMAPSSVARNIDNLEKKLSVTLFKRSTRSLILTQDGQQFLEGAEKLLTEADSLISSMKQSNVEPEGSLRISVFESFGRLCISTVLPEFLNRYPKVNATIDLDNQMVDLNSNNIDIGIRIGQPADSSLRARMLLRNETLLCASNEYLEQHGIPKRPEDLGDHNCLLLDNDRQRTYWHFHKKNKYLKVPVQGNLRSKGGTPLLEAAVAHGGIVQMSNWMMKGLITQKKLTVCLPDWKPSLHEGSSGDIYAVYLGSKHPKPVIRVFIDFLIEKLS